MRELNLSNGKTVLVDDEDYENLVKHKWTYHPGGYACRIIGKKVVLMHREILGDIFSENGLQVDHINRNGLDNQKTNLRFCSISENQRNRKMFKRNKSGYRGVSLDRGRWKASITINGKCKFLGRYDNPEDAFKVFSEYEKNHLPERKNN